MAVQIPPVQFPSSHSLADLNQLIGQYEQTQGPLTKIDVDTSGSNTLLTFTPPPYPGTNYSVVAAYTGTPPAEAVVGKAYISGAVTDVAATRS